MAIGTIFRSRYSGKRIPGPREAPGQKIDIGLPLAEELSTEVGG